MTVGKKTPKAMVATLEGSPMPNHRIKSGSSAILGIGNSADTIGRPAARAAEKIPMARPAASPAAVPMIQPGMMRPSEAPRFWARVPLVHSTWSASMTAAGLGMKSGGSRPALEAACQAAIRTRNTIHGSSRRGTGAKPPPRNGTGRRSPRSDMLDLAVGGGGLVADQRPQPAVHFAQQAGMFGLPTLGHRHVDADHVADAAGTARQHHDSV